MATRRTQEADTTSPGTGGTAKRQPKETRRERQPQEGSPVSQDDRLIGAERFPRKGDEDEEAE
ncbi:MAG TPA: hypothetical protein VEL51_08200 [Vicinamibacterales bacterium]|nr:hypothetical protein [Vicinamibacterales bacterium]